VKEGVVALAALPQSDGQTKLRPVLLLKQFPGYGDWLVCGISAQLWQEIAGFDEVIAESDADFMATGLKSASVVRLGFLASLPNAAITGVIGELASERRQRLLSRLVNFLQTE
jgi:mRNA interferase MazF